MHIDEDQENRVPAHRRLKREASNGSRVAASFVQQQANRRPVLCPIGTNVRKQPVRAAKQVSLARVCVCVLVCVAIIG